MAQVFEQMSQSPQAACNRISQGYNMQAIVPLDEGSYYAGTGYASPDAVTQIANGLSTTTYTYDNNGNLTQKTIDGTTTTHVWVCVPKTQVRRYWWCSPPTSA